MSVAAMLPLGLKVHDPMGQSKSGQLPRRMDVSHDDRVFDPSAGEVYYWLPSGTVGIFYDDLGQSVPPSGMVRLGILDSGVDEIAYAGEPVHGLDQFGLTRSVRDRRPGLSSPGPSIPLI
jgi:hypothetical protein